MSSEFTSSLTFKDLIIEIARQAGFASYGEDGDGVVSIPDDPHDLDECKRHVNNAIRMVFKDSPAAGWYFTRPVGDFTIWGTIGVDTSNKVTSGGYDSLNDLTTLNVSSDSFYETMEGHTITLTGVGDFTIHTYVSAQQIKVSGDATGAGTAGVTWSITANGNYTLPRTFGGQYEGKITYAAGSNQGITIEWDTEANIRKWREDVTNETGDPWMAAVRPMSSSFDSRRRWELMLYPLPDEVDVVQFPYVLHFDKLVDVDEYPPFPASFDELVLAACRAIVERDVDGVEGLHTAYYGRTLASTHAINDRAAPKKLGYFGNGGRGVGRNIRAFRDQIYDRPPVTFNE